MNVKSVDAQEKKVICANEDSPFLYFGWPSITRLPDGTLAMAASGLRLEHVCPFGKGIVSYSRDEGETWTAPAVVMDTPLDDRDCGLTCFGKGRVMLTSFNNTTAFQRRVNAGRHRSESEAERAKANLIDAYLHYVDVLGMQARYIGSTYRISEDGGYGFGPIGKSPVTAPHGPCRLLDGSLLYVGRRFSQDDSFDDGAQPYIQCWRLNEADTWVYGASIENVADSHGGLLSCEPHAIQLPDGKILVHIRVQRSGAHPVFTIYQSESTDGGQTFTKPHPILGERGGAPAHLLLHSSGVLISAYGYREAPYGVRLMFSRDGGEQWDTDYVLDAQGISGDLGYPATVERTDGSLLSVYYENVGGRSQIMQKIWRMPR
jgi:hypothetical protein